MHKHVKPFGAGVVGVLAGVVVAWAATGEAAGGACKHGEVRACPLRNGCGGMQECVKDDWVECHCAGVSFQPGGVACEVPCDGQQGATVCDATCREVVGCLVGSCTICEGTLGRKYCKTGEGESGPCVGPEVCNNCDDDDGVPDNAPGDGANTLVGACNPNQCTVGGTATCTSGQWSACTGCDGSGTCTVCGGQAVFDCTGGVCEGACTRDEECNHCDDNGNGVLDDGLHCPECAL